MIEVKNRSEESWGPLAKCDETQFQSLVNQSHIASTKEHIKEYVKRQKKLKKYKVSFIKELVSEEYEIMAETDYDVNNASRQFFKENKDTIDFKMKPASKWAGNDGYDRLRHVKVRT